MQHPVHLGGYPRQEEYETAVVHQVETAGRAGRVRYQGGLGGDHGLLVVQWADDQRS